MDYFLTCCFTFQKISLKETENRKLGENAESFFNYILSEKKLSKSEIDNSPRTGRLVSISLFFSSISKLKIESVAKKNDMRTLRNKIEVYTT